MVTVPCCRGPAWSALLLASCCEVRQLPNKVASASSIMASATPSTLGTQRSCKVPTLYASSPGRAALANGRSPLLACDGMWSACRLHRKLDDATRLVRDQPPLGTTQARIRCTAASADGHCNIWALGVASPTFATARHGASVGEGRGMAAPMQKGHG